MRKPVIAGNWKMYKTINEAMKLCNQIKRELTNFGAADVVVCPPFVTLDSAYKIIADTDIGLGAQDLFWEKEGAYTGEISPIMLKDCGCDWVIVGHSERRKFFAESDESVHKKTMTALQVGIAPIVCVGETLQERQADTTIAVIKKQLTGAFTGISAGDMETLVIAYEPVWAIGTGQNATPAQAQEVHAFIRGWVTESFSAEVAAKVRIIYGGSVKPENAAELMSQPDIDGALVGGASLDAGSFTEIIKNGAAAKEAQILVENQQTA